MAPARASQTILLILTVSGLAWAQSDGLNLHANVSRAELCVARNVVVQGGRGFIADGFFWKIKLDNELVNNSEFDLHLKGFEQLPDYARSSSRELALEGKYDLGRTNTDTFFAKSYKPPSHLRNKVAELISAHGGKYDFPADAVSFSIFLGSDDRHVKNFVGVSFLTSRLNWRPTGKAGDTSYVQSLLNYGFLKTSVNRFTFWENDWTN